MSETLDISNYDLLYLDKIIYILNIKGLRYWVAKITVLKYKSLLQKLNSLSWALEIHFLIKFWFESYIYEFIQGMNCAQRS